MIYVSLPVHTQAAVVAGQLANFAHFLPEAMVVLHVSPTARFSLDQLHAAMYARRCRNVLVNPRRVPTAWGNIVPAHLANIAFIRRLGDASRICLHASNDMLVRPGLAARLAVRPNLFHRRPVSSAGRWRFSAAALADPALGALCGSLGGAPVLGSQVEGACFEAALMYRIADLLAALPQQAAPQPYPREEIWFSTAANGLGAAPDGSPYVFSEIHRFDRVFWQVQRRLDPVIGTRGTLPVFLRRCIEYMMIKSGFHRIDRAWVDRIARDDWTRLAAYARLSDGDCDGDGEWRVFERHGLYGVKRVPRRAGSSLRRYIDALGRAATPSYPIRSD